MIKGKSLVVGSIAAAILLLGGAASAVGAEAGSGASTQLTAKVERKVVKREETANRAVDSVRCKHHPSMDDRSGRKLLRGYKCRVRYGFGADVWQWEFVDEKGESWWGMSINTPWYNGDWYVDCRQTETKGFCLKLGKRQMRACMDLPSQRGYCFRIVYGYVNLETGKPHRGADPQIVSVKSGREGLGQIVGTGGCYPREGTMPPCAPDLPVEFGTKRFTTKRDSRVLTFGEVEVRAEELEPGVPGTAEVAVQLKVDGVSAGPVRKVTLTGGESAVIPFEKRFFLAEGVHRVSAEISGRGFDHVNVRGGSARLKVFAARERPRR